MRLSTLALFCAMAALCCACGDGGAGDKADQMLTGQVPQSASCGSSSGTALNTGGGCPSGNKGGGTALNR